MKDVARVQEGEVGAAYLPFLHSHHILLIHHYQRFCTCARMLVS